MKTLKISKNDINHIITHALKEDIITQDITTRYIVSRQKTSKAIIIVKEPAVVCGINIAKKIFKKLDKNTVFKTYFKDGSSIKKNTIIASLEGSTRWILSGERTALNFLGYLSGIATNTNTFVKKIKPYKSKILDTRKTTPGLRNLEKYAVRCGGGYNHRFNLNDMVLIKDNHREACLPHIPIYETIVTLKRKTKKIICIEVDNLIQFKQSIKANPDIILLDNMDIRQIKQAVKINKSTRIKKRPLLEVSGGITVRNVRNIAKTGVDRISIGSLTHTHKAIDISIEIIG